MSRNFWRRGPTDEAGVLGGGADAAGPVWDECCCGRGVDEDGDRAVTPWDGGVLLRNAVDAAEGFMDRANWANEAAVSLSLRRDENGAWGAFVG